MHTYSTDNDTRLKVIAGLGVLSYVIIRAAQPIVPRLTTSLALGVSVSAPSFALTWTVIYGIFNKWLWKWKWNPLRYVGAIQVPNLAGTWNGYLETSYQGDIPDNQINDENDPNSDYTRLNAEINIDQNWRTIDIHLETGRSSSDSEAGAILMNEDKYQSLIYQYGNEPEPNTPSSMVMHHGTADLELKRENGNEILDGGYYTGEGRENHGKMRFTRCEETKNGVIGRIAAYLSAIRSRLTRKRSKNVSR